MFEIPEIKTFTSTSQLGISTIRIELQDRAKNLDEVWSRVRDRLDDVAPQLPQGTSEPEYQKLQGRAYARLLP